MKTGHAEIQGSVVAPRGFHAAGVFCNIKQLETGKGSNKGPKPDLALIVSEVPAVAAGMFTTNAVKAAPVRLCISRMRRKLVRGIVANSGNANACTGKQGLADAYAMAAMVAEQLNCTWQGKCRDASDRTNARSHHQQGRIQPADILVASTGRIGVPLPMDRVATGIAQAVARLGNTAAHAQQAALAIMTSDTRPKQIAIELDIPGPRIRIGGICKGAGMIHPRLSLTGRPPAALPPAGLHATMLCFITTDVAIDKQTLQRFLEIAVAESFNRITVDGDTSTNDTVLVLANGLAQNEPITLGAFRRGSGTAHTRARAFLEGLRFVCSELAKMIVRDGEGVHRIVTIHVHGASSMAEADAVARAVANSPLVKTSWHGGDPNWGRVMAAIGYSGARVNPDRIDIGYAAVGSARPIWCVRNGAPTDVPFPELCGLVSPMEFELHINLHKGRAGTTFHAADLTEAYVDFNKGDITNPATLGG